MNNKKTGSVKTSGFSDFLFQDSILPSTSAMLSLIQSSAILSAGVASRFKIIRCFPLKYLKNPAAG